jgi:hypothetical protein
MVAVGQTIPIQCETDRQICEDLGGRDQGFPDVLAGKVLRLEHGDLQPRSGKV